MASINIIEELIKLQFYTVAKQKDSSNKLIIEEIPRGTLT
jgi:hypothetical protein